MLSPRGNRISRYSGGRALSLCLIMHGVHYLTMGFNNARVIGMHIQTNLAIICIHANERSACIRGTLKTKELLR